MSGRVVCSAEGERVSSTVQNVQASRTLRGAPGDDGGRGGVGVRPHASVLDQRDGQVQILLHRERERCFVLSFVWFLFSFDRNNCQLATSYTKLDIRNILNHTDARSQTK